MEELLHRYYSRLGGLTRSLNYHIDKIETAPPERKEYHRIAAFEKYAAIRKTYEDIKDLLDKDKPEDEFVDINEDTGFYIYLDHKVGKYFEVEPGIPMPTLRKYYDTLEIFVNYAFETGRKSTSALAAEIKIIVRVANMGNRRAGNMSDNMNKAFKAYVKDFFGWDFGVRRNLKKGDKISQAVYTLGTGKEALEYTEPIKVGAFFRLSNMAPTVVPEEEYANADIFGEWSRGSGDRKKTYKWDKFDLGYWLSYVNALTWLK